ncbi:MAG: hypothetical protein RJA36_3753 [Pseudomonadota bacterium]
MKDVTPEPVQPTRDASIIENNLVKLHDLIHQNGFDRLRPFLERIEAHILALAGVQFDRKTEPGKLALVA